jgi:hypothetical protein
MKRLADHADEELRIVQPNMLQHRYEIRSGDSVIGEMTFPTVFSSTARAESEEGSWTFHRRGFLRRRTSIRIAGREDEIGSFVASGWTHRGSLHLPDGRTYRLGPNFWLTSLEITTNDGSPLARFDRIRWFLRRSAAIRIRPEAAGLPELPWLVFLGWHIVVLATRSRRTSAGGAS